MKNLKKNKTWQGKIYIILQIMNCWSVSFLKNTTRIQWNDINSCKKITISDRHCPNKRCLMHKIIRKCMLGIPLVLQLHANIFWIIKQYICMKQWPNLYPTPRYTASVGLICEHWLGCCHLRVISLWFIWIEPNQNVWRCYRV